MGCGYIVALGDYVYTWGDNYAGQLGHLDDVHRQNPTIVKHFTQMNIVKASCGYHHNLFLNDKGVVYGTGKNNRYQLGRHKIKLDQEGEQTD